MTKLALIGKGKQGQRYIETIKGMANIELIDSSLDADGIIIATPSETHFEILSRYPDKYLLVEKPLTMNYEQAQSIMNNKIMVGHTFLYDRRFNQFKELTLNMQVKSAHATFTYQSAGNLLWEIAPHIISMYINLFGISFFLQEAKKGNDDIFVRSYFGKTPCSFIINRQVEKIRRIEIRVNDDYITYDGMIKTNPTPLENEIWAFVDFIQSPDIFVDQLNYNRQVVRIISEIEQAL